MPLRLPPLPALRFFEAAGRHQSFKLAAAELNVTPSAVSHGIVGLEQALGVELFVREPRGISLTATGADYLSYVAEAFSLIAIGTQRLPNHRADRPIALSCAPTFASRWLVPRLAGFRERWPKVNVSVDTSHRQVGFPVDGFDFAIRLSRSPVAGAAWTRLFGERFVPVCSPVYLESLRDDGGNIRLEHATLIHVNAASEDWQAWFDATGANGIDPTGGLRVDTIQLAFEAAAMGLGVALGRRPLVDSDLGSGALVEASSDTIDSAGAYWLVSAENADRRPELYDFKRWLIGEAGQFGATADAEGPDSGNASS
ncbi:LysR substrate-binding domain-containing protein [Paraburkholderia strydomiana]|jgi:DNA-binding transcriptional LysR family regulator|uniref:LysR substrate-binding domain-containing protein n=1 Tax=Paraburkholderia strydomiana TaxID=1245417 RepID=UPI0038BBF787